jgi:hypothetical protein
LAGHVSHAVEVPSRKYVLVPQQTLEVAVTHRLTPLAHVPVQAVQALSAVEPVVATYFPAAHPVQDVPAPSAE